MSAQPLRRRFRPSVWLGLGRPSKTSLRFPILLLPVPQSAWQVPPSRSRTVSSVGEPLSRISPGLRRVTRKFIHSHPASSREKEINSPDLPSANERECTIRSNRLIHSLHPIVIGFIARPIQPEIQA